MQCLNFKAPLKWLYSNQALLATKRILLFWRWCSLRTLGRKFERLFDVICRSGFGTLFLTLETSNITMQNY